MQLIYLFLSILATSPSQSATGSTQESNIPPNQGKRTKGLPNNIMWAIIGSCIAVVVVVAMIIIVCCVARKGQSPGGSKGKHVSTPGVFCLLWMLVFFIFSFLWLPLSLEIVALFYCPLILCTFEGVALLFGWSECF